VAQKFSRKHSFSGRKSIFFEQNIDCISFGGVTKHRLFLVNLTIKQNVDCIFCFASMTSQL